MTDTTKICAIIGCTPEAFPWGWDEEDETCAAMKLVMMNRITLARSHGVTRFHVSMDSGAGLYAAEIIHQLRETDRGIKLHGYVPYEEQATKWTPELRDRYFNTLAAGSEVKNVSYEKSVGCEFRTHIHAIVDAGTVIAVFDSGNPLCEREVAAGIVAKMLGKQVHIIDPIAIKLSKN